MRWIILLSLVACGPIVVDDLRIPPRDDTDGPEACPMAPGEPFGPCLDDLSCGPGLFCVPALESAGSVCTVPCSPSCSAGCSPPDGSACNESGSCMLPCGVAGKPDATLCLSGQVCARAGDTAPWSCFWP